MEYAFYNGLKTAAQPKLKGTCLHCEAAVLSKCGSKNIWHWAHINSEDCDSWFEPETAWHRDWKNLFGAKFSEIRVQQQDYYHIADVMNKDGIVFEFQNSNISSETIRERELFYGEKMVWIINGISFKKNFQTTDNEFINDWNFTILNEFDVAENYKKFENGLIIEDWMVKLDLVKTLLSENGFKHLPEEKIYYQDSNNSNRSFQRNKIYSELRELYEKHKKPEDFKKGEFIWNNCRRSWEDSKRPVFIDFGDNFLYWVTSNMGKKYGEGTKIRKEKFIEKYC